MKEHPQEDCTNCTKGVTHWCVCKKCRNNAKIVKNLKAYLEKRELSKSPYDQKCSLRVLRKILGKKKK